MPLAEGFWFDMFNLGKPTGAKLIKLGGDQFWHRKGMTVMQPESATREVEIPKYVAHALTKSYKIANTVVPLF